MATTEEILIAGAGIGGLTLALALHSHGIRSRLIESATSLEEVGAGVNLQPSAMEVLSALSLSDELASSSVAIEELRFYGRHGQLIHAQPRGRAAGFNHPQYSIHRAQLQAVLLAAVRSRLGQESIEIGQRCVNFSEENGSVAVVTVAADAVYKRQVCRALIGCDGIRSTVRELLHPDDGPPRYSGVTMWRGVSPAPGFFNGKTMVLAGALNIGKLVAYPVGHADGRGHQLINWVAEKREPLMSRYDWSAKGTVEELSWVVRDWGIDGLDVPGLIRTARQVLRYPMVDKDPLPFWGVGHVSLLGDAAHPMYPFGSNGACQAILDAQMLANCIASFQPIEAALRAYEANRLPATREIVLLNRESAPDAILDVVDERARAKPFEDIEAVMPLPERLSLLARYARASVAANSRAVEMPPS